MSRAPRAEKDGEPTPDPCPPRSDQVGELPVTADQRAILNALADLLVADLLAHPDLGGGR